VDTQTVEEMLLLRNEPELVLADTRTVEGIPSSRSVRGSVLADIQTVEEMLLLRNEPELVLADTRTVEGILLLRRGRGSLQVVIQMAVEWMSREVPSIQDSLM
jgi:hypothetical protein